MAWIESWVKSRGVLLMTLYAVIGSRNRPRGGDDDAFRLRHGPQEATQHLLPRRPSIPVLIAFFGEVICAILQLINKTMYSLAMFIERLTREIEKNKKSEN